jgi:hypothetical protein
MAEEPEDKIGSEQSIENVFTARESNCICSAGRRSLTTHLFRLR